MSRFKVNFLVDSAATSIGLLARLLLVIFLARILDTQTYAAYILANATVAVGEVFSDFGARTWATRVYALGAGLGENLRFILTLKGVLTSLFGLCILLVVMHRLSPALCLIITAIAFVQPSSDPILWLFRGREQLYLEALFTLFWRIGIAVAMYLVARATQSIALMLIAWFVISVCRIVAEIGWLSLHKRGAQRGKEVAPGPLLKPLKLVTHILPLGVGLLLMCLYQRIGIFALSRLTDPVNVALYGTAFSFVAVPGFLSVSVSNALFPRLSRGVHSGDTRGTEKTTEQGMMIIAVIFGAISIVGVVLAPWIFKILLPARLYAGHVVMEILFPGLYISSISVFLKYCMNALSLNVHDASACALGIVVFLMVLIVPDWKVPVWGAAIAWNAGEVAIFVLRLSMIYLDGRLDIRRSVQLGLVYVILILLAWMIGPRVNTVSAHWFIGVGERGVVWHWP